MSEDLEDRVARLEDEVGIEPLPEFRGKQMVEQHHMPLYGFALYTGPRGGVWVEVTIDEPGHCIGSMADEFVEAVQEADSDE